MLLLHGIALRRCRLILQAVIKTTPGSYSSLLALGTSCRILHLVSFFHPVLFQGSSMQQDALVWHLHSYSIEKEQLWEVE